MFLPAPLLSFTKNERLADRDWSSIWAAAADKKMIEIRGAEFTHFVPPTQVLPSIETILITDNQRDWSITDFPADCFPNLRFLYIYNTKLTAISFKGVFSKLEIIDLAENKLNSFTLPAVFSALQSLQLQKNANLQMLKGIGQQRSLLQLDCTGCNLTAIADVLPLLQRGLPLTTDNSGGVGIHILWNNQIADCPIERLQQGAAAVLKYFEDIAAYGKKTVYDLKIMLVGDRAAGKTALYKLFTAAENEHIPIYPGSISSTARIIPLEYEYEYEQKNYEVYLWDFAGDIEMQPQHQFFITPRGLFLFLINARDFGQINEQHKRNYWLNAMNQLSKDNTTAQKNTVVLIINQRDAHTKPQVGLDKLSERYTQLHFIQEHIDFQNEDKNTPAGKVLNIAKNKKDTAKLIGNIKEAIAEYIGEGRVQSQNETAIKQALEDLKQAGKRYITWQDYEAICKENHYTEAQDISDLAAIFMRLGVIHYFPKHLGYLFLDFDWLSKSIYDFLNYLRNNHKHLFLDSEAKAFWQTQLPNSADCCDDAAMHEHLLRILRINGFESVYEIPHTDKNIVPALLSEEKPVYTLAADALPVIIRLVYTRYVHTILWRTIVRLSDKIAKQNGQSIVWQSGVVFEIEGCQVELIHEGDPDKESHFDIKAVDKGDKNAAINKIWHTILDIHDNPKQAYDYERLVPCNCEDCKNPNNKVDYIKYSKLNNLRNKNTAESDCENGGKYNVQVLLEGIQRNLPMSSDREHFQKTPELPKRKVLFMAANGRDTVGLQYDKEYNIINEKHRAGSKNLEFTLLSPKIAMTINDFNYAFSDDKDIEIVHFAGHGNREGFSIVNDQNECIALPNKVLKRHFENYIATIKLVVLSCCYSEVQAKFLSELGFHVIGTVGTADDDSLLAFMKGFYQGLFNGEPVITAFTFGLNTLDVDYPNNELIITLWERWQMYKKQLN